MLIEGIKGHRLKLSHLDENAIGAAKPKIGLANRPDITFKMHAAVFRLGDGIAQLFDFVFDDAFQTEGRGRDDVKWLISQKASPVRPGRKPSCRRNRHFRIDRFVCRVSY